MKAGINRRQFMQKSLVGAAAAPLVTHVLGHEAEAFAQAVSPNDRIQVGIIGVGARCLQGSGLLDAAVAVPGVEVIGVCDAYKGRVTRALAEPRREGEGLRGLPRAPRRQVDRRRHHRDPRPLAQGDDPRGPRRGQGRLPREADDPHHRRGPGDVRGGREVGPHPPDRQPGHQLEAAGDGPRDHQVGQARPDQPRPRELRPQLRVRRLALPHPPRRRPEDGQLGHVHGARAEAAVQPRAVLPLALLLGLLGRHLDRPLRPPDDDHPLRDGRDRARDGGGDRRPTTATRRRTRSRTRSTPRSSTARRTSASR